MIVDTTEMALWESLDSGAVLEVHSDLIVTVDDKPVPDVREVHFIQTAAGTEVRIRRRVGISDTLEWTDTYLINPNVYFRAKKVTDAG